MDKNKVKFNLKNTHYAKQTIGEDGTVTYGKPVPVPGSVSLSLDAQGENSKFHADGIVYFQASSNNGYEGDLEIALIPEKFRTEILCEELDTKKVLVEKADANQEAFALLFEFDGDKRSIRHVLYNCTATRPAVASQTTAGTKEPVTEKLTISATPMADGLVKVQTGDDTETATYNKWYDAVYVPAEAAPTPAKVN